MVWACHLNRLKISDPTLLAVFFKKNTSRVADLLQAVVFGLSMARKENGPSLAMQIEQEPHRVVEYFTLLPWTPKP